MPRASKPHRATRLACPDVTYGHTASAAAYQPSRPEGGLRVRSPRPARYPWLVGAAVSACRWRRNGPLTVALTSAKRRSAFGRLSLRIDGSLLVSLITPTLPHSARATLTTPSPRETEPMAVLHAASTTSRVRGNAMREISCANSD